MDNIQVDLALKCINRTDLSLFLTGKAGTGKTTFLKNLKDTCEKKYVRLPVLLPSMPVE